jgi:hypothetical protein
MTKNSTDSSRRRSAEAPTGVAAGHMADVSRVPALDLLVAFIGRWMTEGETTDSPATPIVASDIYEWLPGRHFVMHSAYGRIGEMGVGGLEMIGYDSETKQYQTHFFDSQGNVIKETLSCRDGVWTWQGTNARCTGTFSDDCKALVARHERSDDGVDWVPSMNVVLRRID